MGSKGSNTTTTTSSPNQNALGAYDAILSRANALSNQQYVPYTGELVAGVNNQQNLGIQGINNYANYAQPFIGQAASWAQQAAAPITGQQIQQYSDPFTQQVINATQDQFNNTNNQQLSQVKGNAAAQGALGGNREAIAQAETVNQQQKAQAPVLAGLRSQGYQTGLNTALTEQQNLQNAAYGMANLGISGQQAGMSGAGAQIGAGGLQQQTQQALDTANYGQFMNQQAFPYQQLSWLAGLDTGVGSQMGGTSSTTGPPPNWMSQLIGLGTAGAGAAGKIWGSARGGGIKGYADGGAPYSGAEDIFPNVQMAQGNTIPKAPSLPSGAKQGAMGGGSGIDLSGVGKGISAIGGGLGDLGGSAATAFGEAFPETAASLVDFLPFLMLARGGGVRGYDEGGGVAPAPYAAAGQPYASGRGYIPSMQMAHGNTIPKAPSAPAHDPAQQTKDIQAITDALTGNKKPTSPQQNPTVGNAPGVVGLNYDSNGNAIPTPTFGMVGPSQEFGPFQESAALGGGIRGYADGGAPDDVDPNPYIPMGDIGSGILLPDGVDSKSIGNLPYSGVMWPHEGIAHGESLAKGDSLAPKPSFGSRSKIDDPVYAAQNSNGDSWISNNSTTPNGITRENLLRGTGNGVYLEPPTQVSPDYKPERTPNPPSQFANQDTQFADVSTPTGGIAPRSGNYTQPLGISDVSHETPQAHSGISGIDLSKNSKLWDSLMSAGFGMMASRSPFLGVGIGEGGVQGMNTYAGLVKSENEQKDKAENRKLRESEINQKALEFTHRLDQDAKKYTDLTAYEKAQIEQGKMPPGYRRAQDGSIEPIPGGPHDPAYLEKVEKAKAAGKGAASNMTPETKELYARQIVDGNYAGYNSLGRTGQGLAIRNEIMDQATQILMKERGMSVTDAAKYMNDTKQTYGARQIGLNTEARTSAQRETNLNLILKVTDAAVPAALEASDKVERYGGGWVPINKIIQKGQVMTSNPELAEFGMANLQLAEGWARAMNPTGVMRESDRDKALEFLGTATSKDTYKRMVIQLQKQITRERDSIRKKDPNSPIDQNAKVPEPGAVTTSETKSYPPMPATGDRVKDTVYSMPDGRNAKWTGTGWVVQ